MQKRNRMFFAAVLAVAFVAGAAKSSCAGQGLSGSLKRQSLCFDGEGGILRNEKAASYSRI